MPTDLGPEFPPTFTGRPTRSSNEDYAIWQRYWPAVRPGTLRLWFDVGLGLGSPVPEAATAAERRMWVKNTQKRADVLIEREKELWLIELRDEAQASAVGRLFLYRDLWHEDPQVPKPLQLVLVTNREDRDVRKLSEKNGISYLVV